MNYLKIFLLLLLITILTSCEKLFHPEEESIASIGSYEELVKAANGVNGLFQECLGSSILYNANIKGDDINLGNAIYNNNYNSRSCWNDNFINRGYSWSEWNNSPGAWEYLYRIIATINNILVQYDISSLKDKPTREILGEIYLIRAYCYFRLVRTFGKIPVIDNINVDYSVKKLSFTEIYQFIETDLKKAMDLLPINKFEAQNQNMSPHRGTAKAFLAEVYLSWAGYPVKDLSKYTLAAQTSKEVIDSASYFGFGLLDDFGYVWDKAHLYNSESVFSVYFQDPQIYAGSSSLRWESIEYKRLPYMGTTGSNVYGFTFNVAPIVPVSINFFPSEIKFYHDYPSSYRKEITFFTYYWVRSCSYDFDTITYESTLISCDSSTYRFDSTNTCGRVAFRKFYHDPYIFDYYFYYSVQDSSEWKDKNTSYIGLPRVYLFRYSQTLLTYAEATARSGQINAEAYEYVNQIRRRARHLNIHISSDYDLQPGLSAEVFADSIVWERAWEHAGELEGRWFDLLRLEKVEELPRLRHLYEEGPPGYPITKGTYFFPIPESDRVLNPYLDE